MEFQIIALALLVAFYGCYFLKMFIQKKNGIQTDHIGKGKSGKTKVIEYIMKVVTICIPITDVVSILFNSSALPVWARYSGVAVLTSGVVIFIISVLTMKDSWRAGVCDKEKTELVTNGIYQVSRNPAFLGFDLLYIGITIMFFNWILLLVSVAGIIIFHLQIVKVEEPFLAKTFGEKYLAYKNSVNRYLGKKL